MVRMCIVKNDNGTKCNHRCVKGSDMCNFHTNKYKHSMLWIQFWWKRSIYETRQMSRNSEYKKAMKFKSDVDNTRNLLEVRRNIEARLLEIGKRFAARQILNTWRWVNANPNYKVCRDRLAKEFECLVIRN